MEGVTDASQVDLRESKVKYLTLKYDTEDTLLGMPIFKRKTSAPRQPRMRPFFCTLAY